MGAVPQLAEFLRPFAGEIAERAAERLIARFGSPSRMLSAPPAAILEALQDHPALGAQILAARDLADFAARAVLQGERVDPQSPQMRRYLARSLGMGEVETVLAIYVDSDGGFLASEVIAVGSEHQAAFPIRPVISRAFELAAQGIVLAHNHPSGAASPSEQDYAATASMRELAAALGIELIDHLIVARAAVYSMAAGRLL